MKRLRSAQHFDDGRPQERFSPMPSSRVKKESGEHISQKHPLMRARAVSGGASGGVPSCSSNYEVTTGKEDESDEYTVSRHSLKNLEKADMDNALDGSNGGLTMYERVKSRPRNAKPLFHAGLDNSNYISSRGDLESRGDGKRRCMRRMVIMDDDDDENSRETDELAGRKNEMQNETDVNNEGDEEEEDVSSRRYALRQRRAQSVPKAVEYNEQNNSGERPVRSCRISAMQNGTSMYANDGQYSTNNRRVLMPSSGNGNRKSHSSRRGSHRHNRRRRIGIGTSDSDTSSTSYSEDEQRDRAMASGKQDSRQEARFERRKLKSLEKGRKNFMPVNMTENDISRSNIGTREKLRKLGSSCADIDPMEVDTNISFGDIGGLAKHIQSLKEIVMFPMLYPEIFQQFDATPPKGVLFYGAPGTGKTLVARALANECSKGDKKVAFFMRKGADCLSKWVGESERQLRLLFDQAHTMRPSIIFFDEIDGLAPVRSSKQDQIHSSIVSTLLALMDGLDNRGEIIVIGATNRLDSIDPALRRPGRFDREMRFDLPDKTARELILKIHTKKWKECVPDDETLTWLAERTGGYCGADLRALCTEAVLIAVRERFPHIYLSSDRLAIDPTAVKINRQHFKDSLKQIVPASRRDFVVASQQMNEMTHCFVADVIKSIFASRIPRGYIQKASVENLYESDLQRVVMALKTPSTVPTGKFYYILVANLTVARLVLYGNGSIGQTTHFLPVIVNHFDHLPIFSLSAENIFAAASPDEKVAETIRSALGTASQGTAVLILLPDFDVLQATLPIHLWTLLVSSLAKFTGNIPALVLGTLQRNYHLCDNDIKQVFRFQHALEIVPPTEKQRREYFSLIFEKAKEKPVEFNAADYPEPPKARKEIPIRKVTLEEYKEIKGKYDQMQRQLRIFLRDLLGRLTRDRRFNAFTMPVDKDDAADYYDIITHPLCLSEMMVKIDQCLYSTLEEFLADIRLIKDNALEYNPDRNMEEKMIRHNAKALMDMADALIYMEYENSFTDRLQEQKRLLDEAVASLPGHNDAVQLPSNSSSVEPGNNGNLAMPRNNADAAMDQNQEQNTSVTVNRRGRKRGKSKSSGATKRRADQAHLSIVKKYNKLQKNSSIRGQRTSGEEDDEVSNSSPKNSPPVIEETQEGQDSLPVPDAFQPDSMQLAPEFLNDEDEPHVEENQQQERVVEIDEFKLKTVLNQAVRRTQTWPIPDIEAMGSQVTQLIDEYRQQWDRRSLPPELESIVDEFER
ncbi:ATPase family associated with various cellular activities (AAA) domain-containing protein [Ditylenchus destructor]|nr:ATPase family associated with various cellular activities (AAA) domain-containing protein [Ditylenchus destructor]